jgi:hypothetical protein
MTTPVTHFIPFEMRLIDAPRRLRFLAAAWKGTPVAVIRVVAIVDVAVESGAPVKPWAGADENAAGKPFWAVVAGRSTIIGRDVVVAIRTLGCNSDVDADAHLSVCSWSDGSEAASGNGS